MVSFDDMQALARFAHAHLKDSHFLLLSIKDKTLAGQWLQQAPVTSALSSEHLPDSALQIAFTAAGLRIMGLQETTVAQFSEEFLSGMAGDQNRSRRLGDVGENVPANWSWGAHDQQKIHVLLLLYTREGQIERYVDQICNEVFSAAFETCHTLPTGSLTPQEPFGFIDGISQPAIDWKQEQRTDVHARERYSNLLAPGEIVLGYLNEYGQYTQSPTVKASPEAQAWLTRTTGNPQSYDFGINGSYLVVRQLEQHVDTFWRSMLQQSDNDLQAAEELAARMIGRKRDGTPLLAPDQQPIAGIPASRRNNHFTYDADLHGIQCPVGAHIRRSNPRTGDFPPGVTSLWDRLIRALGFKRQSEYEDLVASTRFHRLLRRGRPYGSPSGRDPLKAATATATAEALPDDDNSQGLQFICVTGNILRQFEFVQSAWMESSSFAGTREQRDPLLGSRTALENGVATNQYMQADERGPQRKSASLPAFVTVRGGGYFFMPGLKAIRYLAHIATTGHSA